MFNDIYTHFETGIDNCCKKNELSSFDSSTHVRVLVIIKFSV
jgi:hypothetical protein